MSSAFQNTFCERCESTNDLAKILAEEGSPSGTWVGAKMQTAGRGRQGRVWISLPGNLNVSVIQRIPDKKLWTWVPLVVGLTIAEFLKALLASNRVSATIRLKWPNDVYVDGKKIAGILCEGFSRGPQSFLIVGIGINCMQKPTQTDIPAIALQDLVKGHAGDNLSPENLWKRLHPLIQENIDSLIQFGANAVRARYEKFLIYRRGDEIRGGKFHSIGASGELIVDGPQGLVSIYSEE